MRVEQMKYSVPFVYRGQHLYVPYYDTLSPAGQKEADRYVNVMCKPVANGQRLNPRARFVRIPWGSEVEPLSYELRAAVESARIGRPVKVEGSVRVFKDKSPGGHTVVADDRGSLYLYRDNAVRSGVTASFFLSEVGQRYYQELPIHGKSA